MNTTRSLSINKTPYKTVFGVKPNGIPRFLGEINIDDAFEKVVSSHENEENSTTVNQMLHYVDFLQHTQQ